MKLPRLENPAPYRGLYVFDFGDWAAVGYTVEEIAVLLESDRYAGGKVYRIHRIGPDGSLELRGVSAERFRLESGLLFWRSELQPAQGDFDALISAAEHAAAPPARAKLQLLEQPTADPLHRFVTALIYPAEYEDDMAEWLTRLDYPGGDTVEGGPSHVSNLYAQGGRMLVQHQLWSAAAIPSRSAQEVLATVRRPVQRVLVA